MGDEFLNTKIVCNDIHVQVGLTLVTHFGMGMVIFTSSTWNGNRDSVNQYTQVGMGLTFLPIVCFGPSLMLNLPVPSANVNCGVTYTGRATILQHRGKGKGGGGRGKNE